MLITQLIWRAHVLVQTADPLSCGDYFPDSIWEDEKEGIWRESASESSALAGVAETQALRISNLRSPCEKWLGGVTVLSSLGILMWMPGPWDFDPQRCSIKWPDNPFPKVTVALWAVWEYPVLIWNWSFWKKLMHVIQGEVNSWWKTSAASSWSI